MVKIDSDSCIGCGSCTPYCPVNALSLVDNLAHVDLDLCVECGTCIRARACPVEAITMPDFDEMREIRHYLSDPTTTKKLTGVPGRGTEEVKTNDVTGRIRRGEIGVCIELGRPGIGASFRDVEKITTSLKLLEVQFEEKNPVSALIIDDLGHLDPRVLDERILSGIVEVKIKEEDVPKIIKVLTELEPQLNTVFSLGMISRFDNNGQVPIIDVLHDLGVDVRENAKVNVGIGRPLMEA